MKSIDQVEFDGSWDDLFDVLETVSWSNFHDAHRLSLSGLRHDAFDHTDEIVEYITRIEECKFALGAYCLGFGFSVVDI